MAPGDPPRKPWGAPASYGRGAKKPPAVGARARRSSAPVYNPPVSRAGARGDDDDEGDAAPSRAGTVDDANFRAWQRVASNAKASSRPEKKDASKASTPPSPFGSDIDALAAPDGSYVPLGENTHASFHDLGPEEKRKVAKLIRQVVELSEARSKLEKELDELRARCVTRGGREEGCAGGRGERTSGDRMPPRETGASARHHRRAHSPRRRRPREYKYRRDGASIGRVDDHAAAGYPRARSGDGTRGW